MTTLIMQTYFPRHRISGKRFEPWLQPIAIIEKGTLAFARTSRGTMRGMPGSRKTPPHPKVGGRAPRRQDGLSVTATEGCLLAWK